MTTSSPLAPDATYTHPGTERLVRIALMLALAVWAVVTFVSRQGYWADDLSALWFAGHFWAEGRPDLVYVAPEHFFGGSPPQWDGLLEQFTTEPTDTAFPYIYPPLWAGLMAPVTRVLSPRAFFDVMLGLNIAMLVGSVFLAERIARPASMPRVVFLGWGLAVLVFSVCIRANIELNQPSVAAAFFTLLAFALVERAPKRAGAALAIAAALKVTPIAFALLLLARGRWQALGGLAMTGAALGLASLSMGWPIHAAFLAQLHHAADYSIWAMMNLSPRVLALYFAEKIGLTRWLEPMQLIALPQYHFFLIFMPAWIGRAAALVALAIALPVARLILARPGHGTDALALLGMALGIFLFGPLSWVHYLTIPLLCLPALGFGLSARTTSLVLVATLIACSNLAFDVIAETQQRLLWSSGISVAVWSMVLALVVVALARQPRRG